MPARGFDHSPGGFTFGIPANDRRALAAIFKSTGAQYFTQTVVRGQCLVHQTLHGFRPQFGKNIACFSEIFYDLRIVNRRLVQWFATGFKYTG